MGDHECLEDRLQALESLLNADELDKSVEKPGRTRYRWDIILASVLGIELAIGGAWGYAILYGPNKAPSVTLSGTAYTPPNEQEPTIESVEFQESSKPREEAPILGMEVQKVPSSEAIQPVMISSMSAPSQNEMVKDLLFVDTPSENITESSSGDSLKDNSHVVVSAPLEPPLLEPFDAEKTMTEQTAEADISDDRAFLPLAMGNSWKYRRTLKKGKNVFSFVSLYWSENDWMAIPVPLAADATVPEVSEEIYTVVGKISNISNGVGIRGTESANIFVKMNNRFRHSLYFIYDEHGSIIEGIPDAVGPFEELWEVQVPNSQKRPRDGRYNFAGRFFWGYEKDWSIAELIKPESVITINKKHDVLFVENLGVLLRRKGFRSQEFPVPYEKDGFPYIRGAQLVENKRIIVPAGTFLSCLEQKLVAGAEIEPEVFEKGIQPTYRSDTDAKFMTLSYYAKNVGLVKEVQYDEHNEEAYVLELLSYTLN